METPGISRFIGIFGMKGAPFFQGKSGLGSFKKLNFFGLESKSFLVLKLRGCPKSNNHKQTKPIPPLESATVNHLINRCIKTTHATKKLKKESKCKSVNRYKQNTIDKNL
jgi:hypothetical protein